VLGHFSLARPELLVSQIYDHAHGRRAIASLGQTVEQARAEGDVVATEIMREAAEELTLAAASVIARLDMRGEQFPILLSGGVILSARWLADAVTARLAEVAPRGSVSRLDGEPAIGAVRLALAEARGGVSAPPYVDAFARHLSEH
jgi:N-acetylglucosamine kinase-like BadF-type ATPase